MALALCLASLWLPASVNQPRLPDPPPNRLGVHMLLSEGQSPFPPRVWREHTIEAAEAIGPGGYVVQVLSEGNRDLRYWQSFMAGARDAGLHPIIRLATRYDRQFGWWRSPLPDRTRFSYHNYASHLAEFLQWLRWPPGPRIVVVGNEPNRGDEWMNRPDPAAYARYLRDVADRLRPLGYTVLNAPLDEYCPNTNGGKIDGTRYVDAETFMDGMRAAVPDVFEHIDGWASHAYPQGPFSKPPDEQTFKIDLINGAANPTHLQPPDGVVNRGVNGYEFELAKLAQYGVPPLPVWITETGWRHAESSQPSGNDAEGARLSDDAVADLMRLALAGQPDGSPARGYTPWLRDPRVRAVVFFGFDGDARKWGHSSWLDVDPKGTITTRYAPFTALRGLPLLRELDHAPGLPASGTTGDDGARAASGRPSA